MMRIENGGLRLRGMVRWILLPMLLMAWSLTATAALSVASLNGTWGFVVARFSSTVAQPLAPAPGATLPAPLGFVVAQGTFIFDGAGNFSRSYVYNLDGTLTSTSDGGTYTVAANGSVTVLNTAKNFQFTGMLSADSGLLELTSNTVDPRYLIAGVVTPGTYSNSSLNGSAQAVFWAYDPSVTQSPAPAVGSPVPAPKGFQSGQFALSFDGAGGMSLTKSQSNFDGSAGGSGTQTGYSYSVSASGAVTVNAPGGVGSFAGWLVNGNTLLLTSQQLPTQLIVGSMQSGTYSTASFKGRYTFFVRQSDASQPQGVMPAAGAAMPLPQGIGSSLQHLWADGQGNWSVDGANNYDGNILPPGSVGGTYSVAADGTLTVAQVGQSQPIVGHLLNGGSTVVSSHPAGTKPGMGFGFRQEVPRTAVDFNGDGSADLLWTNSNGAASIWLMQGTSQLSSAVYGPYTGWTVLGGDVDFNGDGKSDLVWTNSNGAVSLWLMNGTSVTASTVLGPYTGWTLVSANCDFDGDGKSDLLWQDTSGQVAIWLMNGLGAASVATFGPFPGWSVVGCNNDFNGDGRSDLLWNNSNGAASIWLMNGTSATSTASFGPYTGWNLVSGRSDYNGDGYSDLLWSNASGQASVWLMNGITPISQTAFGPYSGWSVSALKFDINGDGINDLAWNSGTGQLAVWEMYGAQQVQTAVYGPYAGWSPLSAPDLGGDTASDLLWTSTTGACSLWLQDNLTTLATPVLGPYTGWSVTSGSTGN